MRTVRGWAILKRDGEKGQLFGRPSQGFGGSMESLESNGLSVFATPRSAKRAMNSAMPSEGSAWRKVCLLIVIAESPEDLDVFRRGIGIPLLYVVIYGSSPDYVILGKYGVQTDRLFDAASPLFSGASPFEDLDEAVHAAHEAARQGDAPARVALWDANVR